MVLLVVLSVYYNQREVNIVVSCRLTPIS